MLDRNADCDQDYEIMQMLNLILVEDNEKLRRALHSGFQAVGEVKGLHDVTESGAVS